MWTRWIRRQCYVHDERAQRRHTAMATSALLRAWAEEKASESERVGNEWSSEVASVFTPLRPDRPGQCWCMAATWHAWPMAGRPLTAWRPPVQVCDRRLTARVHPPISPNPWRVSKNLIPKSCRATCKLQLCLNELVLIRAGFPIIKLQSMAHEPINRFLTWRKFYLKTVIC